jgi:crotonobetainyl-CoA:carnitine CoA-transferase CaiB-like acyl-CoA transferase
VTTSSPPLDGIRVVDLTSYIAGSYAAMMLADLGAAVVKVESLEGDAFRELPGFFGWNRGKRSIALNLKTAEGREIVERLAGTADVVMENMRPGVAERLGVGDAQLRAINPRLVYCAVTGFGSTGPYVDRPGFDPILQAMSGAMILQGAGGPPQYLRIAVNDYYAAALASQAILAALFVRERTGRGQRVETSLLHASLALQSGSVVQFPGKQSMARDNPTYRLYEAGDGEWFFLACGNQTFWVKLCAAVGRDDLAHDPRFASWLLRLDNRDALLPILEKTFRSQPRAAWLAVLAAHDIPAAPVQALEDFLSDPAVIHHGLVREYMHPEVGALRLMGTPTVFTATPVADPGPPPTLGEHTDAVLREVGYDDGAIAELHRRAIVRSRRSGAAPRVGGDQETPRP